MRAVGDQVLRELLGVSGEQNRDGRGVLLAADLTPAEAAARTTASTITRRGFGIGSLSISLAFFSLFGAIFANRLAANLAHEIPPGIRLPSAASPKSVAELPPAVHASYIDAFAAALRPVFAVAAGVSLLAFLLTWLLREVPLRKSAAAEGVGESFAMPREAESLPELERIVATLARRENHWRVYERLAQRAGVDLDPAELWVLARLGEGTAIDFGHPRLAAAGALMALGVWLHLTERHEHKHPNGGRQVPEHPEE